MFMLDVRRELPLLEQRPSTASKLPNFFIVGAPKAGTTSLYHYLDQHPQVYMSPNKEPHYFSDEVRAENFDEQLRRRYTGGKHGFRHHLSQPAGLSRFRGIVQDWQDYLRLFADARKEIALGEASVGYLWSPTAPRNIAAKIPHARIIVMLRDPIERAFSQYLHGLGNGEIRWSFREHVQRNMRHGSSRICIHYPFLEFGLYSQTLQRYLDRFGRNVWIGLYDDFKSRPLNTCRSLYEFLGVDTGFTPDVRSRYMQAQVSRSRAVAWLKRAGVWEAAAKLTPRNLRPTVRRVLTHKPGTISVSPTDRRYLLDFYREDILKLSALLGRDLDPWLN